MRRIRLNESQFNRLVNKCIKKTLNEMARPKKEVSQALQIASLFKEVKEAILNGQCSMKLNQTSNSDYLNGTLQGITKSGYSFYAEEISIFIGVNVYGQVTSDNIEMEDIWIDNTCYFSDLCFNQSLNITDEQREYVESKLGVDFADLDLSEAVRDSDAINNQIEDYYKSIHAEDNEKFVIYFEREEVDEEFDTPQEAIDYALELTERHNQNYPNYEPMWEIWKTSTNGGQTSEKQVCSSLDYNEGTDYNFNNAYYSY